MSTTNEISENSIVVGNGVTTIVPFAFNYNPTDTNIEIVVTLQDVSDPLLVTETVLVEGVDYDIVVVSIPLSITTPSIVLEDPIPVDSNLLIQRKIRNIQPLQYDELSPFPAQVHERLVDRMYMSLSELKNMFKKVPKLGKFSDPSIDIKLPDPVDQMYLRWEGTDGTMVNTDLLESDIVAQLENYADTVATQARLDSNTYTDAEITAAVSALEAYASNADAVTLASANAYTDGQLAVQTHPLSDIEQSGAVPGQVPEWSGTEWVAVNPVTGVTDHGLLSGLDDDDHPQYLDETRGDARYYTETETDTLIADFETTTQLNTRDTNNRDRANHTGTQDLDTLAQSGAADGDVATWDNGLGEWVPAAPSGGGGVSDGDKGDIAVSGTGATWTIDNDVVTNAKQANMATQTIKGRVTAATGDPEDLTPSQAKSVLNYNINSDFNLGSTHESKYIGTEDNGTGGTELKLSYPMISRLAHVSMFLPNSNLTTVTSIGLGTQANLGTATGKTINNQTSVVALCIPRIGYRITTAATNAVCNWRVNSNSYYLTGTGSFGLTGTFASFVFGPDTGIAANATRRIFAGFTNSTAASTDIEPDTIGANIVGVMARAADANYRIISRVAGVNIINVDTGIAKAASADDADMFQLIIQTRDRLGTGVRIIFRQIGLTNCPEFVLNIASSDLPSAATQFSPRVQMSVGGTNSVIGLSMAKFYSEQYYTAYGLI